MVVIVGVSHQTDRVEVPRGSYKSNWKAACDLQIPALDTPFVETLNLQSSTIQSHANHTSLWTSVSVQCQMCSLHSWLSLCFFKQREQIFLVSWFDLSCRLSPSCSSVLSHFSLFPCFYCLPLPFSVFSNIHIAPKCSCATTVEIPNQSASPLKNGCILPCRLNYRILARMRMPFGRGEKQQLWMQHPGIAVLCLCAPDIWSLDTLYVPSESYCAAFIRGWILAALSFRCWALRCALEKCLMVRSESSTWFSSWLNWVRICHVLQEQACTAQTTQAKSNLTV